MQHALYLCGGMVLLGIAMLVILAVRGERLAFTIAFWAAFGSIVISLAAGLRIVWQRWIGEVDTPRWIDRVAQLDDRLSTLVAHQADPRPTRLTPTLVSQLFALRYRWEPTTLVPRRVPGSVYFFAAAVIALIATSFVERPPATPQRFPQARVIPPHPNAPGDVTGAHIARVDGSGQPRGNAEAVEGGDAAGNGGSTSMGRLPRGHGAQTGGRANVSEGRMRASIDGRGPGGKENVAARADAEEHDREGADRALPGRVQDMIRQALHQPALDERDGPHGAPDKTRMQTKSDQPQEQQDGTGAQREQSARADAQGGRDEGQERPPSSTNHQEQRESSQGGRGTNGGGGGGQGTNGIYGKEVAAVGQEPGTTGKTFQLKLVLQGQSTRATMEPQKVRRGTGENIGIPTEREQTDAPLNPQQRADEPLVRSEIPPEHEAMIRRIFSQAE